MSSIDQRHWSHSDTFGAIAGDVAEEYYHGFGDLDAEGIVKKYLTKELREILVY